METKEAILYVLSTARRVTQAYLNDLSDADLLVRPAPQAHCIAWQLGHLVISEAMMASGVKPGAGITLPGGFVERHGAEQGSDAGSGGSFCHKAQYIELRQQQRERTIEVVHSISVEELSAPGPEKMRGYAPTKGAVLLAIGTHELMHCGQWAVVRRMLGKAVVI